jgi:menaquinone-dependent protoporphyrinogen oxidase
MNEQPVSSKPVGRRKFLKTGCLVTAAASLTVCGGGALAVTYHPAVDLPSRTYGEKTMENRILVTYASSAGSTAEIAARIGETLSHNGQSVDVLPVKQVTDLTPYSKIVLGSAIRAGNLLPEAMKFVETHQATLQQKPTSVFIACLTLKDDTEENRKTVDAYLNPVRALVKPASEGLFAGAMMMKRLSFIERLMMKAMKTPEGDFRKWDQIEAWAKTV